MPDPRSTPLANRQRTPHEPAGGPSLAEPLRRFCQFVGDGLIKRPPRAKTFGGLLLGGTLLLGGSGCAPDFSTRLAAPGSAAILQDNDGTRAAPVPVWSPGFCLDLLARPASLPSGQAIAPVDDARSKARQTATARLIEVYGPALLAAPRHRLFVRSASGKDAVLLRLRAGSGSGGVDPSLFASLVPTERYVVRGVPRFSRASGQGTPCVGTLQPLEPVHVPGPVPSQPVAGIVWSVTALPGFRPAARGHPAVLSLDLYDPHTTGQVGGTAARHEPLAADYTTPLAVVYDRIGPERRGFRGFIGGSRDFASTGIYASEKPTPDKVPLVLVHGLISDPSDFHVLHNALEADPAVRRGYQVWFFYYPTSLPVIYSSMLLREDLDKFIQQLDPRGVHPALHRAVLVGHSMGGLLCRLAISDGGDRYYHHFFRPGLDQLQLTPEQRELAQRAFYYRGDPNISRVVFVATPHRGSRLASSALGRMARLVVRVPQAVRARLHEIVSRNRGALAAGAPLTPTSSLDSLGPHDPLIAAINDVAMRPNVRLLSILGNRGRGGPVEQSSDGVVPYASAHLPQADSERIVPAGHTGTLKSPETADAIIRVLGTTNQSTRKGSSLRRARAGSKHSGEINTVAEADGGEDRARRRQPSRRR